VQRNDYLLGYIPSHPGKRLPDLDVIFDQGVEFIGREEAETTVAETAAFEEADRDALGGLGREEEAEVGVAAVLLGELVDVLILI